MNTCIQGFSVNITYSVALFLHHDEPTGECNRWVEMITKEQWNLHINTLRSRITGNAGAKDLNGMVYSEGNVAYVLFKGHDYA